MVDVHPDAWVSPHAILSGQVTIGAGSELRINSVVHVNSNLAPGTVVPELFSPERHDELWSAQEPLDFPGTVYGVPRGTSMREVMRRQSELYAPD